MTVSGSAYTFTLNLTAGYQLNGYEFSSGDDVKTSVADEYKYNTEI